MAQGPNLVSACSSLVNSVRSGLPDSAVLYLEVAGNPQDSVSYRHLTKVTR